MAEDNGTENAAAPQQAPAVAAAEPVPAVEPPSATEPAAVPELVVAAEPAAAAATPGKVELFSVGASAVGHVLVVFLVFGSLTSLAPPPEAIPVKLIRADPTPPKPPPVPEKPAPAPQKAAKAPKAVAQKPEPPKAISESQQTPPAKAEATGEAKAKTWKDIVADLGMAEYGRKSTPKSLVAEVGAQAKRCWDIPPGWSDPRQVSVTLRFQLQRDGTLDGDPAVVEFPATPIGAAAAKAAMEAVSRCGPYRLPAARYADWKDIQLKLMP